MRERARMLNQVRSSRPRGNVGIHRDFQRVWDRVESQHYGFPLYLSFPWLAFAMRRRCAIDYAFESNVPKPPNVELRP
jgi:hypothetical protein